MEKNATVSHQRYWLVVILFFHTVNTYMDRACISSAASAMKSDLAIGDQTMGYIFGVFAIGYALFQIPSGWLADALGPRKVLTWVVSLWSIFTMLTGAAFNAASLLIIRFFFGVGEAGAFPGATRALYAWVPARERGLAQGFFHSGARVGAALSLFLMPFLIELVGWRMTFVLNGLVGIAWAWIWVWWFRDNPRDHRWVSASELEIIEGGLGDRSTEATGIPLGIIVTSRNMLLAMFQYIASNITFFISFTWLQPYMVAQFGAKAAYYAPIPLLFGVLAHWTSGSLVTYLHGKGLPVASRRIPAVAGFVISAVGLLLTAGMGAGDPISFVLCFSIAIFGVEMTIAPSWSFCMDIGGKRSGAVSAAMNMLGNLGSGFSAIVFPYFVAHVTMPLFAPTTGTAGSFFVFAAGMNALAALAWFFMNPRQSLTRDYSPAQVRFRLVVFLVISMLLVLALVVYKEFFLR